MSYVAWKRRAVGRSPYPLYWGNAGDWAYAVPTTSTPSVGAIAVFPPGVQGAGSVGHVAYVESVTLEIEKKDGGTITVNKTVDVKNKLNPYELVRNTVLKPLAGRPAWELNSIFAGLVVILLMFLAAGGYLSYRYTPLGSFLKHHDNELHQPQVFYPEGQDGIEKGSGKD